MLEDWDEWRGQEVAGFIAGSCGLPQYAAAAERNFSGRYLKTLAADGSSKGLSRAGIYDYDDQRVIIRQVRALASGQLGRGTSGRTLPSSSLQRLPNEKKLLGLSSCKAIKSEISLGAAAKCRPARRPPITPTAQSLRCSTSTGSLVEDFSQMRRQTPTPYDPDNLGETTEDGGALPAAAIDAGQLFAILGGAKAQLRKSSSTPSLRVSGSLLREQIGLESHRVKDPVPEARPDTAQAKRALLSAVQEGSLKADGEPQ